MDIWPGWTSQEGQDEMSIEEVLHDALTVASVRPIFPHVHSQPEFFWGGGGPALFFLLPESDVCLGSTAGACKSDLRLNSIENGINR